MVSRNRIKTRLVCQNSVISPVGGVNLAGFLADSSGVPEHPMRIFGRYAVVYLLNGQGRYRDKSGVDVSVRPGDLIFVFPDLPHSYGPLPDRRWDEFYIVFDGPIFHTWQETGLISVSRPVSHLEPVEYWLRRLVAAAGESIGEMRRSRWTGWCACSNCWRTSSRRQRITKPIEHGWRVPG